VIPPAIDGTVFRGNRTRWDLVSPDGKYRYLLGAQLDHDRVTPTWIVAGLNPSKARFDRGDMTFSKILGFAARAGASSVVVANPFAYSATDPDDLLAHYRRGGDISGPANHRVWAWLARRVTSTGKPRVAALLGTYVAAWGAVPLPLRERVQLHIEAFPIPWQCFGVTAAGFPRHLCRLPYAQTLQPLPVLTPT
jgi:hypothetical protein